MDGKPARKTRRDAAHKPTRLAAQKCKRTFVLSAEASSRLNIHAVGLGLEVSKVVDQLVMENCRRFVLQDRKGPPAGTPLGAEGQGAGEDA